MRGDDRGRLIAYLWTATCPASSGSVRAAVVLGGGGAGLAAARLLVRHFPRVVVLERDLRSEVSKADEAFSAWRCGGRVEG